MPPRHSGTRPQAHKVDFFPIAQKKRGGNVKGAYLNPALGLVFCRAKDLGHVGHVGLDACAKDTHPKHVVTPLLVCDGASAALCACTIHSFM